MSADSAAEVSIPIIGVRKFARLVLGELAKARAQNKELRAELERLGHFREEELAKRRKSMEEAIEVQSKRLAEERQAASEHADNLRAQLQDLTRSIVATEEIAMLQEAGVYAYRHPLTQIVAYKARLDRIESEYKAMAGKDGGAVLATTNWTVNGSKTEGAAMIRDFSKLMLRAFNAEADNLVRTLKPYKLDASVNRLKKVGETIQRLGKTMDIKVAPRYLTLRIEELELTADFLQREAEQKEAERAEKARLREERKAQQELERERERLEKERQHYQNALFVLTAKGDAAGAERIQTQMADVQRAIEDVDYRAANVRAGYVYVISNIGAFGESMVKVGLTRRLDPMERIRELSDASVPFNFDVHAVFFSKDAVGIEAAMHGRLADRRINLVNLRREFFRATPAEAKIHLSDLAGELLNYRDDAEAVEYRQCVRLIAKNDRATVDHS